MFVTSLRCFRCGSESPFDPRAYLCRACESAESNGYGDPAILDVEYDYAAARKAFARANGAGVFRYLPLLPIEQPAPVLPTGNTPLVEPSSRLTSRFLLAKLLLKDETRNPTRSLKDRATALFTTMAFQLGGNTSNQTGVYCASAGNAAISLAGFSSHIGIRCHVYVPANASESRLDWIRRFGADLHVSKGNYDDAFAEAEAAGESNGWYSRNCAFNPFLVEGKKTVALEIAEQLGRAPDYVIAPVGDGCTLAAIGKGFREARELGIIDSLPQLIGVQSEAVKPIVNRVGGGQGSDGEGSSRAASIAVRRPRNVLRLLRELKEAGGEMIAVSDQEIEAAQQELAAHSGVIAEFTSAATLAALDRMQKRDPATLEGKIAVLLITGGRPE